VAQELTMAAITFRAHVCRARRAPHFGAALFDATQVGEDAHAIDMAALDESELLEIAGGPEFAAWFEGLDVLEQMRFARGEAPPWRETL